MTADSLCGKRILVTGAAGFVGSNLIPELVRAGARVRGTLFQRQSPNSQPEVEYVWANLESKEDCEGVCKGMDYAVLAAANSSGAAVMATTPLVHLTPNLVSNARMLEAAHLCGLKKVLFLSSNTVYPLTDFPVKEIDASYEFYESYFIVGWMKRFSEIMCEMYSQRIRNPMTTIVLRPGNIYGPYDKFDWKKSKVIAALIRRVVERQNPIEVWGDGLDIKDFIYVQDVVTAVIESLKRLDSFTILNIASGVPATIRQIVDTLLRIENLTDVVPRYDLSKPTMIPKRLIDVELARESIGFAAKTSLTEGLRLTLEWYRREGQYLAQCE